MSNQSQKNMTKNNSDGLNFVSSIFQLVKIKETPYIKVTITNIEKLAHPKKIYSDAEVDEIIKNNFCLNDVAVVENRYIVTKTGDIYSINDYGLHLIKPRSHSGGYLRVTFFKHDFYIHRVVASCFLDNPNNYYQISHEDNNKKNNNCSNLKWCSAHYNNKKMFIDGIKTSEDMRKIALKNGARRFNHEQADAIREMIVLGLNCHQLAYILRVNRNVIGAVNNRKGAYKNI